MTKYLLLTLILVTSCGTLEKIPRLFKKEKKKPAPVKVSIPSGPTYQGSGTYFEDITEQVGLMGESATQLYAIDFDLDGYTDLVTLPLFYSQPKFFIYVPETKKYKLLDYNPFEMTVRASYLSFFDVNKDGILDLIAGTLNLKSSLPREALKVFKGYKKQGRVYYKQIPSKKKLTPRPTSSISLIDYDLDGNIDVYEGNWLDYTKSPPRVSPDRLYKGYKNFDYKEVSYLLEEESRFSKANNAYVNAKPTFSTSTCDVDQNGFPDILTSSSGGHDNKMWLNLYDSKNKDRIFKDFGEISGFSRDSFGLLDSRGGGNTLFSLCTDYNNDGIIDIMVGESSHSYDSENKDRSSFLTGSTNSFPPKFLRSEYVEDDDKEVWTHSDRRAVFTDFNNDGLIDVLVENSGHPPYTRLIYFEQLADHGFEDFAKDAKIDILNPSGVITIDVDRDGNMDFITGQSNIRKSDIPSRIYVYRNKMLREGRRSIRLYLEGKKANTNGWGSMIEVKTANFTQKRWVEYLTGPQPSQSEFGMHFGLDIKNALESVTVTWPILAKRQLPLKRVYDLSGLHFDRHQDITLCESGSFILGRKSCK
ncbi:CRTAC1 family protein [Halobacteriovorax sp. HLS]|uniref:CRTAC1 family protein n=1 Tax=Halobacteriovorax sp. HLS TaxID=2234000 RepID=UPI000FD936F7|nr:CRTAC1 family protein [Halobacteriovorax sp. HLS]